MSAVRPTTYRSFAAWEIKGALVSATVVPELGGRIMSYRLLGDGQDPAIELLWQAADPRALLLAEVLQSDDLTDLRRRLGPRHLGGHKTWLAPQSSWGDGLWPFLDLDCGTYTTTIEPSGAVALASPICRETGMRLSRRIDVDSSGRLRVEERMTNEGSATARFGLWSVTQVMGGGVARFPVGPIGDLRDSGGTEPGADLYVAGGVAAFACRHERPRKIGTAFAGGWIEAVVPSGDGAHVRFRKEYIGAGAGGELPHGCAVEIYDFGPGGLDAFEVELLTGVATLEPGSSRGFTEVWSAEHTTGSVRA